MSLTRATTAWAIRVSGSWLAELHFGPHTIGSCLVEAEKERILFSSEELARAIAREIGGKSERTVRPAPLYHVVKRGRWGLRSVDKDGPHWARGKGAEWSHRRALALAKKYGGEVRMAGGLL